MQEDNSTESKPHPRKSSGREITRVFLFFAGFTCIGCCVLYWPRIWGAREAATRSQCKSNLKQLGLALQNYHEFFGTFPPAYTTDANGRPLHSWRVLILPFLNSSSLYNQLKLDESWDSPHNKPLLDVDMPMFHCATELWELGREATIKTTSYVAVIGPETVWPSPDVCSIGDISDGTSNTILVVEVANSGIHWAEPRDLHLIQMSPNVNPKAGMGLSSAHTGGMHVVFCDGRVRFIQEKMPPETIRALLTRAGGEDVGDDF